MSSCSGQAVGDDVEPFARHVQRHAVGQVAAFGQRHAHDGVARLEHGEEHALVGLRAGVRLHVGRFGAEQLLDAVDRQLLGDVDEFAAAVVALARIAFGVLVGQLRALGLHHGRRGVVLRSDQLDVVLLALVFLLNRVPQFRVNVGERVIFCKHEKLQSDIGASTRQYGTNEGERTTEQAASSRASIGGCPGERLMKSHVPRWKPTFRRRRGGRGFSPVT